MLCIQHDGLRGCRDNVSLYRYRRPGEYGGEGTLTGPPLIIPLADGGSFDSAGTEYDDARTFIRLRDLVLTGGDRLTGESRTEAQVLCRKYGLYSCTG